MTKAGDHVISALNPKSQPVDYSFGHGSPRFGQNATERVTGNSHQLRRFLLGHSLGGLIALYRLQRLGGGYAGAVFSAPWLAVAQPRWLRWAARVFGWLFPRIPVSGGIGPGRLTRDPEMAEAWRRDPLIHTRITGGLFREAERVQEELLDLGLSPTIPLLFLLPTADRVVDTSVTLEFARGIVGNEIDIEILEGRFHEPFNDLGREEVFDTVARWLAGLLDRPGPKVDRIDGNLS